MPRENFEKDGIEDDYNVTQTTVIGSLTTRLFISLNDDTTYETLITSRPRQ